MTLPSLFDEGKSLYRGYGGLPDSYAPFPVQVIIDQDGIIRYLSGQYDAERVRSEIRELLDEAG